MNTRRKLKDAIAQNDALSYVFGQASVEKIAKAAETATEQNIPLNEILCTFTFVPGRKPVRHFYDPEELQQWALTDIKPNGIRSPLWVRPHPEHPGKYELVAGLRRLKAASLLQLETVPVKIFTWDDSTAFQAAISENANRRDFSALEELDNTLRLLEIHLGMDTEEVISLLYRMNNAAKGTTNQNVLVSPEATIVKQVFDSFGRITWQSFVATRLPLQKKPLEILNAIRSGDIQYTKGILLASVKDPDVRQGILEESIARSLSLNEIKQRIKEFSHHSTREPAQPKNLQQRLTYAMREVKKNKSLWRDPLKTQQLEQLIGQLETMMMG